MEETKIIENELVAIRKHLDGMHTHLVAIAIPFWIAIVLFITGITMGMVLFVVGLIGYITF